MVVQETRNQLYKKAIEKWGQRAQLEMLQEEATELSLAARKFIRNQGQEKFEDLCSEIADVQIMIEQVFFMFPEAREKANKVKLQKLERLQKRIKANVF
jgi:NTP pyrophosphatase (non-canonical NTP hydrolase)